MQNKAGIQMKGKPTTTQRQRNDKNRAITSRNSFQHFNNLKRVENNDDKPKSQEINGKKGKGSIYKNGVKQTHISPVKLNTKNSKINTKSENKKTRKLLKHIVPINRFSNGQADQGSRKSDIIDRKVINSKNNKMTAGSKRSFNWSIKNNATQIEPMITKRNKEPINPLNLVPRNALNQIEANEKTNGDSYEAEIVDGPENKDWDEKNENIYKKEDDDYDRPYRRQQTDEAPRRRWEDDEEEEEHHHHENATDHSSFEHRLTEKLLDAILSEHGRHEEHTQPNEHPNLGKCKISFVCY